MAEAEKKEEEKKEGEEKAEGEAGAEKGEGAEGAAEGGKPSKKKLIIILVAAVLLLGGGGGAGFYFLVMHKPEAGDEKKEVEVILDEEGNEIVVDPNKVVYVDLAEFLVNLNTGGKQSSFLKMVVTLELPSYKEKKAVEDNIPKIRDAFQIYLRELRSSDLQGSAGMQRLREELLLRINKILHPVKISDILFKEIIVQ